MSDARNTNEICENNNQVEKPPEVDIERPTSKDIGTNRVDRSTLEGELPIDVLLVTVKDDEFVYCYSHIKDTAKRCWWPGLGMVDFGTFGDGGVKVALIRCAKGSVEPRGSLISVRDAVEELRPKVVVCVGYCGSINRKKAKLGDVVISAKLATYSNEKVIADGPKEIRGIKVNVSKNMGLLIPYAADGWQPPLKEPNNFEVGVHREYAMLSGPQVVDDSERRQELLCHCPDAIAIEMEGQGLYTAAYDLGVEWVVVKGVSDYADGSKTETKSWQPFASAMAASIVCNMFKYSDVIREWPNYTKSVQVATSTAVTPTASISPIEQFLRSIFGTTEGRRMYNGRTIDYSVFGRIHSLKEPWVYDATARDVVTGETVEKKHFKTADMAIKGAVEELVKKLEERQLIKD